MPKSAVLLLATNSKNVDSTSSIQQYLSSQLVNFKYTVQELCISDKDGDSIKTKLEYYVNNCDIILLVGKIELVCNLLSKTFHEKLVVSDHLASVYNSNNKEISVVNSSKIFQVQNHANGINPVLINFKNIFILPCDLLSINVIFQNLLSSLMSSKDEIYSKNFVLKCSQNGVETALDEILNKLNSSVSVKKYCTAKDGGCELNVVLASSDFVRLIDCQKYFKTMVQAGLILNEQISNSFWENLDHLRNEDYVLEALNVIKECYTKYSPEEVFLSFNGGKDCTVLLYLTVYILRTLHPQYKDPLLCLYVQSRTPFQEIENFIEQCREFYCLEIITINNTVKAGLEEILAQRPNFRACLMGTRKTDPFAEHLGLFQMTDPEWPQIMRVNPVLNWKYADIWTFLRTCKVPYCVLYDIGYTSLGSKTNTGPNPALKYKDEASGEEKHWPAYKLLDGSKERSGRLKL